MFKIWNKYLSDKKKFKVDTSVHGKECFSIELNLNIIFYKNDIIKEWEILYENYMKFFSR